MPLPSYYSSPYMPSGSFNSSLLGRLDYSSYGRSPSSYIGSGGFGGMGFSGGGFGPIIMSPYGTGPYGVGMGYGSHGLGGYSKYLSSPMPTISESGGSPALNRRIPRSQNYIPPIGTTQFTAPLPRAKLTTFDTENIDVTSPRDAKPKEISRERNEAFGTIKRGRTVIRIQTKQLKENPYLVDDLDAPKEVKKPKKTVGQKLKEKYMLSSVKKRRPSGYRRPTLNDLRIQQEKDEGEDELIQDGSLSHDVYRTLESFLEKAAVESNANSSLDEPVNRVQESQPNPFEFPASPAPDTITKPEPSGLEILSKLPEITAEEEEICNKEVEAILEEKEIPVAAPVIEPPKVIAAPAAGPTPWRKKPRAQKEVPIPATVPVPQIESAKSIVPAPAPVELPKRPVAAANAKGSKSVSPVAEIKAFTPIEVSRSSSSGEMSKSVVPINGMTIAKSTTMNDAAKSKSSICQPPPVTAAVATPPPPPRKNQSPMFAKSQTGSPAHPSPEIFKSPVSIEAVIPWRRKTNRKFPERPLSSEILVEEPIEVKATVPWRRKTFAKKPTDSELPEDVQEIIKEMEGMNLNSERRLSAVEFNFILPNPASAATTTAAAAAVVTVKSPTPNVKSTLNSNKQENSSKARSESPKIQPQAHALKPSKSSESIDAFRENYKLMRDASLTLKIPTTFEEDGLGSPDYWAERRSSFCSRRINTINESLEIADDDGGVVAAVERPESPDFWKNRGCSFVRRRDFVKAVEREESVVRKGHRNSKKGTHKAVQGQVNVSEEKKISITTSGSKSSKVEKSGSNDKLAWSPSWRNATQSQELMKQTALVSNSEIEDRPKRVYERNATKTLRAKLSELVNSEIPEDDDVETVPDKVSTSLDNNCKSDVEIKTIDKDKRKTQENTTAVGADKLVAEIPRKLENKSESGSAISEEGWAEVCSEVHITKEKLKTPEAEITTKELNTLTVSSNESKSNEIVTTNSGKFKKRKRTLSRTQESELDKSVSIEDDKKLGDSTVEIIASESVFLKSEILTVETTTNSNPTTTETENDLRSHSSVKSSNSGPGSSGGGKTRSTEGSTSTASSTVSTSSSGSRRMPSPPSEDSDEEDSKTKALPASENRICPAKCKPKYRCYYVHDFQFLKVLGKGSFGKVLLAELKGTESYYAVKCLKKDVVLEDDDVDCTMIERKVLLIGSKHPYLCHLLCTFQTDSHLFFVMEYLNGGDLMFHIQQSGRFSEERGRFYAAEIVSGLKFLHKKGIIYRDLKLDNILLDFEGHVRIADFGMCKLQIFLDRTADTFCGTPDYMAPEIIKGMRYNQCVDWWAFGVLVFEMLVGQSPFSGSDEDELFWSICNEPVHFPRFLSREAKRMLELLLEKDACRRLGAVGPYGDVKDQLFFSPIDWDLLEKGELEPPFKPKLRDPLDVKYFDTTFTKELPRLTPVDKEILRTMDQTQFDGFSYTNPHTTD